MKTLRMTLTTMAASLVFTGAASAGVISLNITGGASGDTLTSTDEVGVVAVANWNNTLGDGNVQMTNLMDNSGVATTADVATGNMPFAYNNDTPTDIAAPLDDDAVMMRTARGQSKNGRSELPHERWARRKDSIMAVRKERSWRGGSSRVSSSCRR